MKRGFTLAELLIALAILGVIATFTIPKVLQSQQDGKYKAMAKEVAATISAAYDAYKLSNSVTASTSSGNLTPYLNYVKLNTSIFIDDYQTQTSTQCDADDHCFFLHNGGVIRTDIDDAFGATASTNAIIFEFDPDGKVTDGGTGDASATAPGKAIQFFLYYGGRLRTYATIENNTCAGGICRNPNASLDPPWFAWD